MLEPLIIKLLSEIGVSAYIGYVPEKKLIPAVTIETLNNKSQKLLRNYDSKVRRTNITINVFGNTITETKLLQQKVFRFFESFNATISDSGYKYTISGQVVNSVDMFSFGTNKATVDVYFAYQEQKL